MWNRPPPPGFQELRDGLPLRVYQRGLPHWRQEGATYFVTFRLADSLPQAKLRELAGLRAQLVRIPPKSAQADELSREITRLVERWLDQGEGSCLLSSRPAAEIVAKTLKYFDGDRFELGAFVVMPNHVHAILRPFSDLEMPLERILQTWKRQSATEIKTLTGRLGAIWQEESFDRIIRDAEHLYRTIAYVGDNPKRANLSPDDCMRWIRPQWVKLGWGFPF